MPEGEEEEQEIENLFEQIMKENFPNLAKEIDFQEVQEAQSPKEIGSKEAHTKAHHNYITKIQDNERILKTAREKDTVTYKGVPIRLSADFSKENLQAKRLERSIPSHERLGPTSKIALSSKAFI